MAKTTQKMFESHPDDRTIECLGTTIPRYRRGVDSFLERITRGAELAKLRLVIDEGEGNGD
jgi:hypothetical protein